MGTEYYIVKPSTKEIFYLGKRIRFLDGVNQTEAKYVEWECYHDCLEDLFLNNFYFFESDYSLSQIYDFVEKLYNFCDAPVYFDNDCSETFCNWKDYKEVDVFSDMLDVKEQLSEIISLIPQDKWIVEDHIVNEFETIVQYIKSTLTK